MPNSYKDKTLHGQKNANMRLPNFNLIVRSNTTCYRDRSYAPAPVQAKP
jgi:hypothetical protein